MNNSNNLPHVVNNASCPVCQSATAEAFSKDGYALRRCTECPHWFAPLAESGAAHAAQVYGDEYFTGGGAGYADYLAEAALLRAHGRRYGALLKRHAPVGTLLDVGAAAGFVAQGLRDEGWSVNGLEPNPRMAAHAREQLGLAIETGTLETVDGDKQYSVLTLVQVVAHFYDLRQAFAKAAQVTQSGGYWLIETWRRDSWTARVVGQNWHEYSPPSVLHWFTPESLRRLCGQFGMAFVAQGRPVKRLAVGHAKSLLRHKLGDSPAARAILAPLSLASDDRTLPYPAEDLFWALFRKTK